MVVPPKNGYIGSQMEVDNNYLEIIKKQKILNLIYKFVVAKKNITLFGKLKIFKRFLQLRLCYTIYSF